MALDPVCKMQVDPKTAAAKSEYQGQTYYFCVPGCKAAFDKDPAKYLQEAEGGRSSHHQHHKHWASFSSYVEFPALHVSAGNSEARKPRPET